VLVVFSCTVMVSQFVDAQINKDLAVGFKGIWVFAEVFFFYLLLLVLTYNLIMKMVH